MIDVTHLIKAEDFIEQHIKLVGEGYSHYEAFQVLNGIFKSATGHFRFKDFDSFRRAKSYHQNKAGV